MISIHAPTRGATGSVLCYNGNGVYFNPRSYKRSDTGSKHIIFKKGNFNPRSYKRSDLIPKRLLIVIFISIHAPTRGATELSQPLG